MEDLPIRKDTIAKLQMYGYLYPTSVQHGLWRTLNAFSDTCIDGAAGSGKTSACVVALLDLANRDDPAPRMLFLTHSADAVATAGALFGVLRTSKVSVYMCGGKPSTGQIVVGTPAQVLSLIRGGAVDASAVTHVVVDDMEKTLVGEHRQTMGEIVSSFGDGTLFIVSRNMEQDIPEAVRADVERFVSDVLIEPVSVLQDEAETGRDFVRSIAEFENMELKRNLLRGVYSYGFEKPSNIQQKAIVTIATGRDVIAQSQSGTGKTGAFTIGVLNRIDENLPKLQAMIMSPTRELAEQILAVCKGIGTFMKLKISLCIGGVQTEKLDNSQLLIGTPGRILDILNKVPSRIDMSALKMFTLDEADEMLSRGFKEQIYEIFQFVPRTSQILLFSATMPGDIIDLTGRFMVSPVKILLSQDELTLEGIKQYYIQVDREDWKFETLMDLYRTFEVTQCVIFCNSRQKVEMITERLSKAGYSACGIHSELATRRDNMEDFKTGKSRMLVTTDLLARGIDVQHISLVINYDIPKSNETYIHRIGRSGRFGRKGIAINFFTRSDEYRLREIENHYKTVIDPMPSDIKIN